MRRAMWLLPAFCACAAAAESAGRWEPVDIVLASSREYANPFRDVKLLATLRGPSGRTTEVSGVYDGGGKWLLRAAFDEEGVWRVDIRSEPPDPQLQSARQIRVTASKGPGPVRLDPRRGGFVHAGGSGFFHVGDTCYPLLGLDRETQRLPYLRRRAEQGFSHIRFHASFIQSRFPDVWAWGGTRTAPDHDRLSPEYFNRMDSVMRDLRAHGLKAEIILTNYYRDSGPMSNRTLWNAEREKQWLSYLISRYAAFDTVLYWTVANEFEVYPDGNYRFESGDAAWARATAALVKSLDPYGHPVTVHPFLGFEKYVEWFGRAPEIDFLMLQEHGAEKRIEPHLTEGDGAGLEDKIRQARATGKVVVDGEFGYEWDGSTRNGANVSSDLQRAQAWRIVMGGGHFSAGFRSTVYNFAEIKFDVDNGGRPGARFISILAKFFRDETRFTELEPHHELTSGGNLCLRGKAEYVVYAPRGGAARLDISHDPREWTATWLNPVTGERRVGPRQSGGAARSFESPWSEAVLHLRTAQ